MKRITFEATRTVCIRQRAKFTLDVPDWIPGCKDIRMLGDMCATSCQDLSWENSGVDRYDDVEAVVVDRRDFNEYPISEVPAEAKTDGSTDVIVRKDAEKPIPTIRRVWPWNPK